MDSRQIGLIQDSWAQVTPLGVRFTRHFYDQLLSDNPELHALFPESMADQEQLLFRMINSAVSGMPSRQMFEGMMNRLGNRHQEYGVNHEHFRVFGEALIATLANSLGERWNPDLEAAWRDIYGSMAQMMQSNMDESQSQ